MTELSPGRGRDRRRRATHRGQRRPSTSRSTRPRSPARTFTLRNATGQRRAPPTVSYDAQTRDGRSCSRTAPLAYDAKYTATLKGGAGGVTDAAGNPLAADRTWSFTVAGQSPAEGPGGPILRRHRPGRPVLAPTTPRSCASEGLNAFATADGPVTARQLAGKTTVILGLAAGQRRRGDAAHELGAGRRQPDRDAAGQEARRPARAHRRRQHARRGLPEGRHAAPRRAPASRRRRCSTTAPPTATRSTARPRSRRCTRTPARATAEPGRVAARRRHRRRPGGGVQPTTSRARSSTRARATRPGRARSATARQHRHPHRRPLLRRQGRATSSPTGST